VTLTYGSHTWQSTSEVNDQRPNRASMKNFAGIYKTGGPKVQFCLYFIVPPIPYTNFATYVKLDDSKHNNNNEQGI